MTSEDQWKWSPKPIGFKHRYYTVPTSDDEVEKRRKYSEDLRNKPKKGIGLGRNEIGMIIEMVNYRLHMTDYHWTTKADLEQLKSDLYVERSRVESIRDRNAMLKEYANLRKTQSPLSRTVVMTSEAAEPVDVRESGGTGVRRKKRTKSTK